MLKSLWVSNAPLSSGSPKTPLPALQRRAAWVIAWVIAVVMPVYTVFVSGTSGSGTDDFTTVFSALRRFHEGVGVYEQDYASVSPLYLYNPGATVVLSPIAIVDYFAAARLGFIVLNAAAIIAALAILTTMMRHSLRGLLFPVTIALAFLTEPVRNTLIFANINGVVFLALVLFMWLVIKDRVWSAGVIIGLAILIKPLFLPLLVLPLMKGKFQVLAGGLGVPIMINVLAWPLVPGVEGFTGQLLPYLSHTRDYANASIRGITLYFGVPAPLVLFLLAVIAAAVAVATLGLARWRYSDPMLWLASSSGILLIGVYLLSSLGQQYYTLFVFPMIFTALASRSLVHHPVVIIGIFLALFPLEWKSGHWEVIGTFIDLVDTPIGWALIVLASAVTVAVWVGQDLNSGMRGGLDSVEDSAGSSHRIYPRT